MSVNSSLSAGQVLAGNLKPPNDDNPPADVSSHTEPDAFGSGGDDSAVFEKSIPKSILSNINYYRMDFASRGYAIIVNNENFHPLTSMFFGLYFSRLQHQAHDHLA